MLKYSDYSELVDTFEEEIKLLKRKIEYRKLELKKLGLVSGEGEVVYDPGCTTRASTASTVTISGVANVPSGYVSGFKPDPCEFDEELAKLRYELDRVEKRYAFMKKYGILPD